MITKALPYSTAFLRVSCCFGLVLLLLMGGVFAGIVVSSGGVIPRRVPAERLSTFHRSLREYDFKYRRYMDAESPAVQLRDMEGLDNELDRLEKRAEGVESWLSILKRRKQLAATAGADSRYIQAYRQSALRAARAFPHSEPIAAVAVAALVQDTAISADAEAQLRNFLPLLASSRFVPMRLSLHILLGDFNSPENAAERLRAVTGSPLDAGAAGYFFPFTSPRYYRQYGTFAHNCRRYPGRHCRYSSRIVKLPFARTYPPCR